MTKTTPADFKERTQSLNAKVQQGSLRGAWQRDRGVAKQEEISPAVWRWSEMAPLLLEAGELAPLDDVMRMRTLHMINSPDSIPLGAARTFAAMLQHVNAGEVTDSHRHTATSIYFMIQGSGIYTTAEGEQQFMEPGDLLTQPSWTWHGTTNTGSEPAIWFTAMDTTLMQFLDNWVNERYPESFSWRLETLLLISFCSAASSLCRTGGNSAFRARYSPVSLGSRFVRREHPDAFCSAPPRCLFGNVN